MLNKLLNKLKAMLKGYLGKNKAFTIPKWCWFVKTRFTSLRRSYE